MNDKTIARPLWVIAICASISTLILIAGAVYAGLTYVSAMQALSEFGNETSQTETAPPINPDDYESCDPEKAAHC